jgi:hypothetical protein
MWESLFRTEIKAHILQPEDGSIICALLSSMEKARKGDIFIWFSQNDNALFFDT